MGSEGPRRRTLHAAPSPHATAHANPAMPTAPQGAWGGQPVFLMQAGADMSVMQAQQMHMAGYNGMMMPMGQMGYYPVMAHPAGGGGDMDEDVETEGALPEQQQQQQQQPDAEDGDEGVAPAPSATMPPASLDRVGVSCNGVKATFMIHTQTIVCKCPTCLEGASQGAYHMTPTDFERHSGMSHSKKWRRSIKAEGTGTRDCDDHRAMSLGRWLEKNGFATKDKVPDAMAAMPGAGTGAMPIMIMPQMMSPGMQQAFMQGQMPGMQGMQGQMYGMVGMTPGGARASHDMGKQMKRAMQGQQMHMQHMAGPNGMMMPMGQMGYYPVMAHPGGGGGGHSNHYNHQPDVDEDMMAADALALLKHKQSDSVVEEVVPAPSANRSSKHSKRKEETDSGDDTPAPSANKSSTTAVQALQVPGTAARAVSSPVPAPTAATAIAPLDPLNPTPGMAGPAGTSRVRTAQPPQQSSATAADAGVRQAAAAAVVGGKRLAVGSGSGGGSSCSDAPGGFSLVMAGPGPRAGSRMAVQQALAAAVMQGVAAANRGSGSGQLAADGRPAVGGPAADMTENLLSHHEHRAASSHRVLPPARPPVITLINRPPGSTANTWLSRFHNTDPANHPNHLKVTHEGEDEDQAAAQRQQPQYDEDVPAPVQRVGKGAAGARPLQQNGDFEMARPAGRGAGGASKRGADGAGGQGGSKRQHRGTAASAEQEEWAGAAAGEGSEATDGDDEREGHARAGLEQMQMQYGGMQPMDMQQPQRMQAQRPGMKRKKQQGMQGGFPMQAAMYPGMRHAMPMMMMPPGAYMMPPGMGQQQAMMMGYPGMPPGMMPGMGPAMMSPQMTPQQQRAMMQQHQAAMARMYGGGGRGGMQAYPMMPGMMMPGQHPGMAGYPMQPEMMYGGHHHGEGQGEGGEEQGSMQGGDVTGYDGGEEEKEGEEEETKPCKPIKGSKGRRRNPPQEQQQQQHHQERSTTVEAEEEEGQESGFDFDLDSDDEADGGGRRAGAPQRMAGARRTRKPVTKATLRGALQPMIISEAHDLDNGDLDVRAHCPYGEFYGILAEVTSIK